jgi:dolichol-phosphate mannosyltransferase
MKLSIVLPAHNEQGTVVPTLRALYAALKAERIPHEILVVNDNSTDRTGEVLTELEEEIPTLTHFDRTGGPGFGRAVRAGLERFTGDAVVICMADGSDSPADVVRYYRTMIQDDVDCVFGSRFMPGAKVTDYPVFKLFLNRVANKVIQLLFGLRYNDVTNAFKMFRKSVISGVQPLLSHHFNLTVEIPLKAIVRGYDYSVVPTDWCQRKSGESKLKIKEMGSRYLFIILYCFIEKWLSRGDYHREDSVRKPRSSRRRARKAV